MDYYRKRSSSSLSSDVNDTSNDASIAQAMADADREAQDLALARRLEGDPAGMFVYPGSRKQYGSVPSGRIVGIGPTPPPPPPSTPSPPPLQEERTTTVPPASFPMPPPRRQRTHMCHVPCIIGDGQVCVEMMVDTGAEASVMSWELAKSLGLGQKLDRSEFGVAAGVGRARILGKIRHVITTFGNGVEFQMEFSILDIPDRLLLLGMDQMRKYNCIIDLQRDLLIFGGAGGRSQFVAARTTTSLSCHTRGSVCDIIIV